MFLRISDQVKIRVRQVHGSGEKLSLGLYLRPSNAESASCGWVGDLFSGLNPVTGLQNVLNGGGWTALGPENFVLVRDGDNLVQNGGFEKDGSGKLLSTGDGAFTATSLQGWGSLNNKFEYWRHHNDMDAAGGNYFLELDVDQASKSDAVYQELAVKKGKDYRVLVETARRPDAEDEMTNTLRMVLMQYEGPNARDRGSRVIVGPGHKKWAGFSIVARTLSGGDGKAWVGFSEDVGTDDSYGGLLDNVIVRQINESRAVCPSP